ncbi:MAG: hypothetical protein M1838_004689 [Thelocarpon superellum]|nr:MAG: hypothetical protein M1838_004689 [Thelocarpon superellum]
MPGLTHLSTTTKCPALTPELQRIQDSHAVLASTGCSAKFCQAGRAVHTDEPRVGENRTLAAVLQEAEEFLRDLHRDGVLPSDDALTARLQHVREEICLGAIDGLSRQDQVQCELGGNWTQTPQELEFGLRRAWRNARKCIMRSHTEELKLCDLRHVNTSAGMARALIDGMVQAFNGGTIQPTVFVFPPRTPNSRGPMIWNHQILAFAGYQTDDGSVLGDPKNVELTNSFIELGWLPPKSRSRWDLLPLVTMAEGDLPVIAELPASLRTLVPIRHPHYGTAFEELDLKWVPFPALTRLGFDIGGVQYTAAPFVGWFMDAEIGVRNLGDTSRYNVLPDVVRVLGLTDGKLEGGVEGFDDLPEYERLMMLSRAQAELNYAVHWSFLRAGVSMSDSMTASTKWIRYDDAFQKKHGYRLPSDPYWLAPPQGSIIPLWHRGAAPNYQPKPLIARHVEDPIKAWGREKDAWSVFTTPCRTLPTRPEAGDATNRMNGRQSASTGLNVRATGRSSVPTRVVPRLQIGVERHITRSQPKPKTKIVVRFCSEGTMAENLAGKLHGRVQEMIKASDHVDLCPRVEPLDNVGASDLTADKIFLLVISSTGQGAIPANGLAFAALCGTLASKAVSDGSESFRFDIFGNGDSRYSTTYNGGASKMAAHLRSVGGVALAGGLFEGDTAAQGLPLSALNAWWDTLKSSLMDVVGKGLQTPSSSGSASSSMGSGTEGVLSDSDTSMLSSRSSVTSLDRFFLRGPELLSHFRDAVLVKTYPAVPLREQGSVRVTLDIGLESYKEMSCIQILPVTSPAKVMRALDALCVKPWTPVELGLDAAKNPSYARFLREYVDLEQPFVGMKWWDQLDVNARKRLDRQTLRARPVLEVLEHLQAQDVLTYARFDDEFQRGLCLDMAVLHPRTYSVASSLRFLCANGTHGSSNKVDVVVKVHPQGRFSSVFLNEASTGACLRYRFVDGHSGDRLRQDTSAALIIVATGAGFGPVRCLLQQRIAVTREHLAAGGSLPSRKSAISLFLGLRRSDVAMTIPVVREASSLNLIDMLSIVPSNENKTRVHDKVMSEKFASHVRRKLFDGLTMVYVCTNLDAAKAIAAAFDVLVGGNEKGMTTPSTAGTTTKKMNKTKMMLGERYIEEVF